MVSEQAKRAVEGMVAQRANGGADKPLAQVRREWEEFARTVEMPEGARVIPVIAGGIAGEWVEMPGGEAGRVLLLLHGGGYNAGSPLTHRKLGAEFARVTGMRVLIPDYRLAPEHPFPAAVKDALLAYGWLISEGGLKPRDIVAAGDSSGGGLALSMLLALREASAEMPRAAVLLSPWTDLTLSSPSYAEREASDPSVTFKELHQAAVWYAGQRDPADPMASAFFADLSGLPPLLIHVGENEILLDDGRLLAERAGAAGVAVTYKMWPGLWHVFHFESPDVPEAAEAMEEIGAFVRAQFSGSAAE